MESWNEELEALLPQRMWEYGSGTETLEKDKKEGTTTIIQMMGYKKV